MSSTKRNSELQYQGYINTPLLWQDHPLLGLEQLEFTQLQKTHFNIPVTDHMPLGKLVERFVMQELRQQSNISILSENIQIQNQKITIGEIDCLLRQNDISIHLEIIYKFYLYDPNSGPSEIDRWIGPNRNDNLLKKLHKLKDKQLPLLHKAHTKPLLDQLTLNLDDIVQKVLFKAQLFTPYNHDIRFDLLNKDCLTGFYIHLADIAQFSACTFYIPNKLDWLIEVQANVEWIIFDQFSHKIKEFTLEKRAPLCWIKFPDDAMQKFFVVWW